MDIDFDPDDEPADDSELTQAVPSQPSRLPLSHTEDEVTKDEAEEEETESYRRSYQSQQRRSRSRTPAQHRVWTQEP